MARGSWREASAGRSLLPQTPSIGGRGLLPQAQPSGDKEPGLQPNRSTRPKPLFLVKRKPASYGSRFTFCASYLQLFTFSAFGSQRKADHATLEHLAIDQLQILPQPIREEALALAHHDRVDQQLVFVD